ISAGGDQTRDAGAAVNDQVVVPQIEPAGDLNSVDDRGARAVRADLHGAVDRQIILTDVVGGERSARGDGGVADAVEGSDRLVAGGDVQGRRAVVDDREVVAVGGRAGVVGEGVGGAADVDRAGIGL